MPVLRSSRMLEGHFKGGLVGGSAHRIAGNGDEGFEHYPRRTIVMPVGNRGLQSIRDEEFPPST